jgi:CubicO group peptidase (beta-lactamase class C family)
MKSKLSMLLLIAGIACSSAVSAAKNERPTADAATIERLQALAADREHEIAPGCAIGVFRSGKPLALTAAGYADVAQRRPIDADTLFYAASVSKQFTALAVAKLIEARRLSLDDDVRRYLPELPQYQVPVTVRMLLYHTAGIRDSLGLLALAGVASADKSNKEAALRLVFRQKATNFVPGSAFSYSNGGYLLLAEIVARVSGMSFADYAQRAVLDPMGMKHSFFLDDASSTLPNVAHGYALVQDKFEIRDTYPRFSGSGGLLVSLNDLARYEYDIEIGHKVWTEAVRKVLLEPGTLTSGDPAVMPGSSMAYGGGLQIGWRKGQRFVQHAGGAEAFTTLISRLPDRRSSVALLCNRSTPVQSKADEAIELIEGDILQEPVEDQQLAGRYYSDELQVHYDLTLKDNALSVAIIPAGATQPAQTLELKREGEDGPFKDADKTLVPARMGQGFVLDTGRSRGLYFQRVEASAVAPSGK